MNDKSITPLNLNVDKGKDLLIRQIPQKRKPPFGLHGTGKENGKGRSMNLVKIMSQMNSAELWLFDKINSNRIKYSSNVGIVRSGSLSKQEKKKVSEGYKNLRAKDCVRRVKREYYMINPMLILPEQWEEELQEYKQLK